jgi:hypothetical protein
MKTLFTLLILASLGFSQAVVISGQGGNSSRVWWGTSADSSLRVLHRGGFVYYDSAGGGTNYKRIDNTADSCSRPFLIASRMGTYPIWKYELEARVRAVNAASNAAVYRVETRYVKDETRGTYWGWRRQGRLLGYADVTVQDSVVFPHTGLTSKMTVAGLFFVTGDQGRLCTDNATGTSTAAGDSVKSDTLIVRRQ